MKEGRDLERKLSPRLKNLKEKTQYRKAPKGNELTLATLLNRVDSELDSNAGNDYKKSCDPRIAHNYLIKA